METPSKDYGTQLAEERTAFAVQRSYFAAERTLMAWLRTALSMISFGFTMVKFFEYLDSSRGPLVGLLGRTWSPGVVGLSLISIGIGSLALAIFQHRKTLVELRKAGYVGGWSLSLAVSALIALLGLFALVTLLLGH